MKYKWGNFQGETYNPKAKLPKQLILGSLLLSTGAIPGPNFLGIFLIKLIPFGWVYI